MTINEYQKAALRTVNPDLNATERLIDGLMGMNGEAGEAIDILKKHLYQGHELDTIHLLNELGDVIWYIAVTADAIGYDLETVLELNITKLRVRYPNGFSSDRSVNRGEIDL